jgi:hypothetical protein
MSRAARQGAAEDPRRNCGCDAAEWSRAAPARVLRDGGGEAGAQGAYSARTVALRGLGLASRLGSARVTRKPGFR